MEKHPHGHILRDIEERLEEIFDDEEFIEHSAQHKINRLIVILRNIAVVTAVFLFLIAFFVDDGANRLRSAGYFFGAACYVLELVHMTHYFTQSPPLREMFMAYLFGPLYLLMGISYLLH